MGSVSPVRFRILMELVSSGEAFTNGESGLSGRCLPDRRLFVVFFCRRATAARSLNFLEIPSQSGFFGLCYECGESSHTPSAAALASSRTAFPVSESPVGLYSDEGNSYRTLPKEIVRENPCFFIAVCSPSYTSGSPLLPREAQPER